MSRQQVDCLLCHASDGLVGGRATKVAEESEGLTGVSVKAGARLCRSKGGDDD